VAPPHVDPGQRPAPKDRLEKRADGGSRAVEQVRPVEELEAADKKSESHFFLPDLFWWDFLCFLPPFFWSPRSRLSRLSRLPRPEPPPWSLDPQVLPLVRPPDLGPLGLEEAPRRRRARKGLEPWRRRTLMDLGLVIPRSGSMPVKAE